MQYPHCVFQNAWAQDLLAHAIAQCPIDPFMISENKARLKEDWDARNPFAEIVERAFDIQDFALDAGRPINNREVMAEVYTVIYQT